MRRLTACGAIPLLLACAGCAVNRTARPDAAPHSQLPERFEPAVVRHALLRHLDEDVLPYWTARADVRQAASWTATVGWPLIRHLRLMFGCAVALERGGRSSCS